MAEFLIPNYIKRRKETTYYLYWMYRGRHRSVAIANALYKDLLCKNFHVTLEHRDINEEDINRGDRKL